MIQERDKIMNIYKIHPIVMGTKHFDKGMKPYHQHEYGAPYTIPIYFLLPLHEPAFASIDTIG
jgi:hypothetical protein